MKPMTEQHLALFRRHMVEIIDMHFDLAGDEIGRIRRIRSFAGRSWTCLAISSCRRA